jgi:hypothetical protein
MSTSRKSAAEAKHVFRGLSPTRKSVLRSAGVSRSSEPILSWVFSPPGYSLFLP